MRREDYFLLDLIINKEIQTFITSISLNYFNKNILDKGKYLKLKKVRQLFYEEKKPDPDKAYFRFFT